MILHESIRIVLIFTSLFMISQTCHGYQPFSLQSNTIRKIRSHPIIFSSYPIECRSYRYQRMRMIDESVEGFVVSGETLWSTRRKIISTCVTPILQKRIEDKNKALSNPSVVKKGNSNDPEGNIILTSVTIAISVLAIRLGGRVFLMQMLGLDGLIDHDNIRQIDEFIAVFQSLDPSVSLLAFGLAWFFAKALCIDAIGVALALSSGILFQGLLPGVLASVSCSTFGSFGVFLLSRYFLRDRARQEIEKRPALRAIDRACSTKGFQTVFTLRLSPILPIPIGAYNYLYGASSVPVFDFLTGTALGAIKPYLLDCYLGLLAKDVILPQDENAAASGFSAQDIILLITVVVVTLVGSYAAQIAQKIWKEIQLESSLADGETSDNMNDASLSIWTMLGIDFSKDVPEPIKQISAACERVNLVIKDEISAINSTLAGKLSQVDDDKKGLRLFLKQNAADKPDKPTIPRLFLLNNETSQPLLRRTGMDNSLLLVNSTERTMILSGQTSETTYKVFRDLNSNIAFGSRNLYAFEAQPTSTIIPWDYQQKYLAESMVFGILLISALFSNPELTAS